MTTPHSKIKLLQNIAFFGGIRDDIISLILESSSEAEVTEGDRFFEEGDSAKAMYILEDGCVAVLKGWKGKDYLLRKLNSGDCFGEMALMDCMPRSASVVALEDCKAIEIPPSTLHLVFNHDLEQFTMIEMNMGREVCRRLRAIDKLMFEQNVTAEIKDNHVEFSSIQPERS